ncbi:uncharacterized protein LOC118204545 [Stegodyphus dumicola]|uniref:uncharacterized protein LOC118204545 n=1 Tax=Stegodyphus dumicola TaxID=202533 RepID=UPI0015B08FC8|nr:uncharacterized protein LOC118204545 [Stegodyphus dumicola]
MMDESDNVPTLSAKRSSEQSESPNKRAKLSRKQEESHFLRLFWTVQEIIRCRSVWSVDLCDITETDIEESADSLKESFRLFEDIDFTDPKILCGYIHRYAGHGAGLARESVLEAINSCDDLKPYLNFREINVISLGAGPGSDVIGFCSAFYEYANCSALNITLVDSVKGWSSCFNIVEFLTREGDFGNATNLFKKSDITTSYLQVDLMKKPLQNSKFVRALQEADIIIMQKLLSIIPFENRNFIIENTAEIMKEEAVLLLIDTPFQDQYLNSLDVKYRSSAAENYQYGPSENKSGQEYAAETKAKVRVLKKKQKEVN